MRVPYENLKKSNELFIEDFKKSFGSVLDSGWFILGKEGEEFEGEFAVFHGAPYCLGVASGLDALTLSLIASDLPQGAEILVPSNTYIATILSIFNAGLKPVLVEPDLETYNIDPKRIPAAITDRTRGIMVVHLYGKSCDMDPILEICRQKGLMLFEDCAQSHNATYKGRKTGVFGDFGCFSFYPTKNLGALGDAGAILCKSKDHYKKLKALRNYGSFVKYYNEYIGTNSRLDEVQAGFLRVKLRKLEELTAHKRRLAGIYFDRLDPEKFVLPKRDPDFLDVYHIFNIRHRERNRLREYLLSEGIVTEIHYPVAPHRQKAMLGRLSGDYPVSEMIHETTLSLPISFAHSESDIHQVCDVLENFR
jgi:dTDP-4-amino-4,6-dideoxygalactose transaminase